MCHDLSGNCTAEIPSRENTSAVNDVWMNWRTYSSHRSGECLERHRIVFGNRSIVSISSSSNTPRRSDPFCSAPWWSCSRRNHRCTRTWFFLRVLWHLCLGDTEAVPVRTRRVSRNWALVLLATTNLLDHLDREFDLHSKAWQRSVPLAWWFALQSRRSTRLTKRRVCLVVASLLALMRRRKWCESLRFRAVKERFR